MVSSIPECKQMTINKRCKKKKNATKHNIVMIVIKYSEKYQISALNNL